MHQPLMPRKLKLNDLWRPTRPYRTKTKKDILFITGDWNEKVESQEIPVITGKFGLGVQNKAGQRLIEFCQENAYTVFQHSKHPLATQKRQLYTRTSPDGQYWNQIDYSLCSQRWRKSIESAKQHWELTVAQIMNSLLCNSGWNGRK